jgi:hypothetical protein
LGCFPPALGLAGLICGIFCLVRGSTVNGIVIVILSLVCATVGMIVGWEQGEQRERDRWRRGSLDCEPKVTLVARLNHSGPLLQVLPNAEPGAAPDPAM